jgi:hypothetical protein
LLMSMASASAHRRQKLERFVLHPFIVL